MMLDRIAEKIAVIFSDHSSANIHLCGNFNIHQQN